MKKGLIILTIVVLVAVAGFSLVSAAQRDDSSLQPPVTSGEEAQPVEDADSAVPQMEDQSCQPPVTSPNDDLQSSSTSPAIAET